MLRGFGMTPASRADVTVAPGHNMGADEKAWAEFDDMNGVYTSRFLAGRIYMRAIVDRRE